LIQVPGTCLLVHSALPQSELRKDRLTYNKYNKYLHPGNSMFLCLLHFNKLLIQFLLFLKENRPPKILFFLVTSFVLPMLYSTLTDQTAVFTLLLVFWSCSYFRFSDFKTISKIIYKLFFKYIRTHFLCM